MRYEDHSHGDSTYEVFQESARATVTGRLEDETPFMGSDTIKVKVPTGKNLKYIAP